MGCGLDSNIIKVNYIKIYKGSFVGVEGSDIVHTMPINLFSPYKQLLRASVILKPGQCKFLLNHLGLGDNATFLSILATYDNASRVEADNFVQYSYYTNPNNWYSFAQMLVLTGNSENRIEQLYLSNPNQEYGVKLDILVGVIDDEYNFLNENFDCEEIVVNGIIKFINVTCEDILSWSDGSIVVKDPIGNPQIYIDPYNINTIERNGSEIVIDDRATGTIILVFTGTTHNGQEYSAEQEAISAYSKLSAVVENSDIVLDNGMCHNTTPPCITFTENVSPMGASFSVVQSTCDGTNTVDYWCEQPIQPVGNMTKPELIPYIVENCNDLIDGDITLGNNEFIINKVDGGSLSPIDIITEDGIYYITFVVSDIMGNYVNPDIKVQINVIIS